MANLRVDKITSTETFETTGSVQFDGANDHLDVGSAGDFNYLHDNTGTWTAEFWVCPQVVNSRQTVFSTGGNSSATGFCTRIMEQGTGGSSNGYFVTAQISKGSDGNYLYWASDPTRLDADTWYHIALVYDNTDETLKIYVDGKLTNSGFSHETGTFGSHSTSNSSHSLHIGEEPYNNALDLTGHLSNFRILNEVKLYTSDFKPPMRELEVTSETTLLCCQSKTDATLEKTGKTITVNGNAVASELTPGILTPVPKAGAGSAITGSVEFSGGTTSNPGDYLSVPNTEDLRLGSSDFTVEAYVNFTNGAVSNGVIVALWDNTDNTRSWNFYFDRSNGLYFAGSTNGSSGNNNVNASIDIEDGEWYHVAACRSGSTIKLFVNGIERASNTSVGTYYENTVDPIRIGAQNNDDPTNFWKGFISNLRIVKGTALYTDDFIPPTRELKKVPGTVLLCCQDPDNPLTEATGKTITPYGSLGDGSLGGELVTRDGVWTLTKGGSGATDWTVSNNGSSLAGTTVSGGYMRATYTLPKGDYLVSLRWTGGAFAVQDSTGYIVATDGSATDFGTSDDGAYSFYMTDTTSVVITATSWSTAYTVDDISIKRIYRNNGASNFTPQVGDDRKVTFEGVSKVNSDAYFYLPTGNTESRDSGGGVRGVFVRGQSDTPTPALLQTIEYINISSTGNAIDFGDAAAAVGTVGACSDSTRGIQGGGQTPSSPSTTADILKLTIASTGTAVDSGADILSAANYVEALSSSTRAVFVGGSPPGSNVLQFTEIQSLGNTVDFGDLNNSVFGEGTCCDGVRGVVFGGTTGPSPGDRIDNIDYITVSSKGDAQDFGNLGAARAQGSGFSNKIRGIYAGGRYQPQNNIIEYITIATTGDAKDFGDLISQASRDGGGTCSSTRGVHAGGDANPSPTTDVNTIQYITIMSMGNAFDFGDLTERKTHIGACSNGHGGLG